MMTNLRRSTKFDIAQPELAHKLEDHPLSHTVQSRVLFGKPAIRYRVLIAGALSLQHRHHLTRSGTLGPHAEALILPFSGNISVLR